MQREVRSQHEPASVTPAGVGEGASVTRRTPVARSLLRGQGVLLALVVVVAATGLANPRFFSPVNLETVGRQIAIFGLLALGETFVILTGGIDLSVGSMTALSGIVVAWFITRLPGIGLTGAVALTLLLGAAVGAWHGLFVTRMGVPPFVITLATFAAARGLASVITRGWPISGLPEGFRALWESRVAGVLPMPVAILLLAVLAGELVLRRTAFGVHLYAVGGHMEAARRAGIHVNRIRTTCYVISSTTAALVGILIASRLGQGNPTVGNVYELYAIAAAVIGGVSLFGGEGTAYGSLIGASIISIIWNALVLLRVSAYWHDVAVGAVIAAAVTYDIFRRRALERAG